MSLEPRADNRGRRTAIAIAGCLLLTGAGLAYSLTPASAGQNPVLQNPGLQNSGLQNPGLQNPGLQNPGLQNPGLQNPGLQNPAATVVVPLNLDLPAKKDIAMQLVSAAENSSLDWRAQFRYIEDIGDGRGYTAGIIGFCSGTGDMLELVEAYTATKPGNVLAKYLPALRNVDGTDSHAGLDPNYPNDWRTAAADPVFQAAQESERDRVYFNPSVRDGKADGLRTLGQFAYYDAAVMHGYEGMRSIRTRAVAKAKPPAQGGNETTYLNAFLDERVIEMNKEEAHSDTSRVDTAQRVFLRNGNVDLNTPLDFAVYGEAFHIG